MRKNATVNQKAIIWLITLVGILMAFACAHPAAGEPPAILYLNCNNREEAIQQQPQSTEEAIQQHLNSTAEEASDSVTIPVSASRLPVSLQIIEDEAFEGTSLTLVEISEKVEKIGERAFANIPMLRSVKLSQSTRHIAKNAFSGSDRVTLTGMPGGYTRTWAKENGIPFTPITAITATSQTNQFVSISAHRTERPEAGTITGNEEKTENNPTGHTAREIKDPRYEEGIAYHILGRAPPACA